MSLSLALIALFAGLSITILSWYLLPTTVTRGDRLTMRKRQLYQDPGPAASTAPLSGYSPFATILERLQRWLPAQQLQQLELRLGMAGLYGAQPIVGYLAAKVVLTVVGLGISTQGQPLWAPVAIVLAYYSPNYWLRQRIQRRQQQIQLAMPDAMDIVAVSVEAGLTLDSALQRFIAHEGPTSKALSQEIRLFLKDIQLGRSRREAFADLGERSGVRDLKLLAAALNQADQWGVEMVNVIRVQADNLRTCRLQRAEERAMKAPIKMLFPLVFFIFPAIFIVLLGPAALRLMKLFPGG